MKLVSSIGFGVRGERSEIRSEQAPAAAAAENLGPRAGTQRVRILLVEDDVVDRMAFERFVRQQELAWDYELACRLDEARILLDRQDFDVALADYHLGDGCGLDLLGLGLDLPFVMITGLGDEETAVQAMRAGAYDYLVKDGEGRYLKKMQVTVENARQHQASKRRARILGQALTSINDAIYISDLDDRLVFVNDTFCNIYGYRRREILGQQASSLWAQHRAQNLHPLAPADLPTDGQRGECCHRRRDGSEFAALLSRSPIFDERGRLVSAVGAVRDISERKQWEEALRESEERYALAAAGANDGLWDWDLRSGEVYYSSRWKATLGYDENEIPERIDAWFDLVHSDDFDMLQAQIKAHIGGRIPHFENEHRIRTRAGKYRWVQVRGLAVRDGGGAYRIAGSQRDITARKRAEEQLLHAALHDSLTGLPNRALFMDRLNTSLARIKRRGGHGFAVLFFDLDRFKVINDSLGHQAGDRLLQALAERLQLGLRPGDTVARLGGDEFAILLDDIEEEPQVHEIAGRLQELLRQPFDIEGQECFTDASLGIALSRPDYEKASDLLRDADIAMYRAKSASRTRRVVFEPAMHSQAVMVQRLESDLHRGVEREEFTVHFQPLVDLVSGQLAGFEALVRWHHPERGLLYPGEFLPLAQETELSNAIGWWVLRRSCQQLRAWQLTHPETEGLAVSVNLDAAQLAGTEVIQQVETTLEETQLSPELLRLEITEGMIFTNPELTAMILSRLRRIGVRLHIDDFGTGYSSLSQLKKFPVDTLKIDRSFVAQMLDHEGDLEIVRTIIQLGHNLGLDVSAEGIETAEQLERLQELGCEFGQGFLFSRALPPSDLEEMISGRQPLPGFASD